MKSHRMKYQLFPLLFSLMVVCVCGTVGAYSGGSGVPGDEFIISTSEDLVELSRTPADWQSSFILSQDIDMEGYEITPIGLTIEGWQNKLGLESITVPFTGTFCGNNHQITNLTVVESDCVEICVPNCVLILDPICQGKNVPADCPRYLNLDPACNGKNPPNDCLRPLCDDPEDYSDPICGPAMFKAEALGLFGVVDGLESSISCVILVNPTIITDCALATGALVGHLKEGVVSCCAVEGGHVLGALQCDTSVGGLVGLAGGVITKSYSTAWVIGTSNIGGLVGHNYGVITNSFTAEPGRVTLRISCCVDKDGRSWKAGGFVGTNDGVLDRNYASIGIDMPPADGKDTESCIDCCGCTGAFVGYWMEDTKAKVQGVYSNFTDKVIVEKVSTPTDGGPNTHIVIKTTDAIVLPAIGCDDPGPNTIIILNPCGTGSAVEVGRVVSVTSEELKLHVTFGDASDPSLAWDFDTVWTINETIDSPRLQCHVNAVCNECP